MAETDKSKESIVIFGADGMLGSALARKLEAKGLLIRALVRADGDATDLDYTRRIFTESKPTLVFNCIAYNAVDAAEEKREVAELLNVKLPKQLAELCKEFHSVFIHYSSGYVFDGQNENGYAEDDSANPQSVYAQTKWQGEQAVRETLPNYYLIRLNWLFGIAGPSEESKESFPDMILKRAISAEGQAQGLKLIKDEFSTPTYVEDLAQASIQLSLEKYPFGTYHLSNDGKASWYDYGVEVIRLNGVKVPIQAVTSAEMPRVANRPRNSALLNNKFPKLRPWQEALAAYYKKS
jgi:dTDP-4-dehydrorhamnose reductase